MKVGSSSSILANALAILSHLHGPQGTLTDDPGTDSHCSYLGITFQEASDPNSKDMIEQRMEAASGLLPRPHPLSENLAANAALLARLSSLPVSRPPVFPFAPGSLPPFLAKPGLMSQMSPPGGPVHPMLASLPQLPEIRARLLGLQFPPRQESQSPQFSPPGFLGNFAFNRDGSDSPVDGKRNIFCLLFFRYIIYIFLLHHRSILFHLYLILRDRMTISGLGIKLILFQIKDFP